NDLFTPTEDKYIVVFYSSREKNTMQLLSDINLTLPVLAFDYYNKVKENSATTTFLRSGTKNSLAFIQRFNIYESPSISFIKRTKDTLYKQDSMIRKLDNLKELSKKVDSL
ncbi:MAG: hypothetical protein Q9M34_05755, partial [Sulfurimonas sp.]|nr:hypothetical protein [Sulfurimonas sp.]